MLMPLLCFFKFTYSRNSTYPHKLKQNSEASQSSSQRKEPLTARNTFLITSLNTSSSVYGCVKAGDLLILLANGKQTKRPATVLNHCMSVPAGNEGSHYCKKKYLLEPPV